MKKLILLFTLLTGVTFAASAQTKPGEFKFESNVHDFGKIPQGKPVTYEFKFTNTGDAPLIIKTATAECGCTTPVLLPVAGTPIKKGEKGTVKVTFTAPAVGGFTKRVTIMSNLPLPTELTIKGEVTSPTAAPSSSKE